MLPKPWKDEFTRNTTMTVETNLPVEMRDGTVLRADVYRPAGDGRYPVLLARNPYGKQKPNYHSLYLDPVRAASRGYATVFQDTRGRHASQGEWYPFRNEIDDGYDTVEWCGSQSWSDGNVGMFGISYHGATQWLAAVGAPPSLKAIAPGMTADQYYDGWTYLGGVFQLFWKSQWAGGELQQHLEGLEPTSPEAAAELRRWTEDPMTMTGHLPLKDMPALKGLADYYYDWLDHPAYDDYWKAISPRERFDNVRIPALNIGGWWDGFQRGTIRCYQGMQKKGATALARTQQHLLIGPWMHRPLPRPEAGSGFFGEHASGEAIDIHGMMLAWYDHWLKGEDNGVDTDPRAYYFVMGENAWHTSETWPPPGTEAAYYFLHGNGKANTRYGDGSLSLDSPKDAERPDHFLYDPLNPVPSHGGPLLTGSPGQLATGVADQDSIETRHDVLVYTSEPLEKDLEVTGVASFSLWAVTSAPDTDWTAKLTNVHPEGKSFDVTDGILRARFRDSLESPTPITPGEPYKYDIDLGPTSMLFKRGHRIRVQISSSNFPYYARNLNTGGPNHEESEPVVAAQTALHDAAHPSCLILPVVPR